MVWPPPTATTVAAITEATAGFELVHVMVVSVAFEGNTVAVSAMVCFRLSDAVVGVIVIELTGIIGINTVTTHVAVNPWFAVIIAVPAAIAVTSPLLLTVTTEELLDDQRTV